jgi:formamidopyrimidine-DNA glycosylase
MAELPEIAKIAGQMRDTLRGKTIQTVTLLQEKCANISQSAGASTKENIRYERGRDKAAI